jgi:outer membrane protein TolC
MGRQTGWLPCRVVRVALVLAVVLGPWPLHAQPQPGERVTFDEAVARAIEQNPSAAIAAAGILRADALLAQVRSSNLLQIGASAATTTLNTGVEFEGTTVTPRNSVTAGLDIRMPLYAPVGWARRAQAEQGRNVAELGAAEVRRQTALATADAYLSIVARRRVVEANVRARDLARAYFELASELERQGRGSRLDRLRAQQVLSSDETVIEAARMAVYRSQEALGVLLAADGPVDAAEEPTFVLPPASGPSSEPSLLLQSRANLRLFAAETRLAERVLDDSSKDRLPYVEGIFQPRTTYPGQFFAPSNSWQLMFQASVPLWDSGQRSGQRLERQASLDQSRATLGGAVRTATSELRTAREAVASAERTIVSARAAAAQSREVVDIIAISVRAGGATNIEVIDAERRARDADNVAAIAEDAVRRAQLDLLTALGLFPR